MATKIANPADIRWWAKSAGLKVADRGRLSQFVIDAYLAAHPGTVVR